MKFYSILVMITLTLIVSPSDLFAQTLPATTVTRALDVSGALFTRNNQYIINKARNGWIMWAQKDSTSNSETTLNLSNINNLNVTGNTFIKSTLDLRGDFFASGNIYTLNKAQNNWVLLGSRNTTTAETTMDLFNINNAHVLGNIGIGVAPSSTYKLNVNGTIHAKEVLVNVAGFPDYVFDENYELMNLSEVDNYIKSNRHLPNIPCAKEVEEKGIDVAKMQVQLLQKIEELTLYVISQQKEIDLLKGKLDEANK